MACFKDMIQRRIDKLGNVTLRVVAACKVLVLEEITSDGISLQASLRKF